MKLWKRVLIKVLLSLMIVLVGITLLMETTSGLRLLLNGAERWIPGFSIKQVEGNWHNLTLKDVQYNMPGITVSASEFHLEVQPSCLKDLTFCVNNLWLKDINVLIDSNNINGILIKEKKKSARKIISTPYPVILRHLNLHNVNVKIDNSIISLLNFTTGLNWKGHSLTLTTTHIQNMLVNLPKKKLNIDHQLIRAKVKPKSLERLMNKIFKSIFNKSLLEISLSNFHLPLNVNIQEIVGEQLHLIGNTELLLRRFLLKAKLQDCLIQLQTLDISFPKGQVTVHGHARLADNWPINLTMNGILNLDFLKEENIEITLIGALCHQLQLVLNFSGPLNAQFSGQTELAATGLLLQMKFHSSKISLPLIGIPSYQVDNLDFSFSGKAANYAMSLRAILRGYSTQPIDLALDVKGDIKQFNKLSETLKDNTIPMDLIHHDKVIRWRSELTLTGINTTQKHQNWFISLNGKMITYGSLYDASWQLCTQLQLRGKTKSSAISANVTFYGNSYNQWNISNINFMLSCKNFNLKKSILGNKVLKLDIPIDALHLDNVLLGLNSMINNSLKSRIMLLSSELLRDPSLAIGLDWKSLCVTQVQLKGSVSFNKQIAGKFSLSIDQLKKKSMIMNHLTLDVNGDEKSHQLKLKVNSMPISGNMIMNGSFDRYKQHWQGTLNHTMFNTPIGRWKLMHPVIIDYTNTRQTTTISAHCWHNSYVQFCVPKPIKIGTSGHAHVELNHLDLAVFQSFLPRKMKMIGTFSGYVDVVWYNNGSLPTGHFLIKSYNTKVMQNVQGNTLSIIFDILNLGIKLHDGNAELSWLLCIADNGQLDGRVKISNLKNRRDLSGNINTTKISLTLLNSVLDSEKISGVLHSTLRLKGNLQCPHIYGQVKLYNIDIKSSSIPVDLINADFNMLFNGMSSQLEGVIKTTKGQINLNGNADWHQVDDWYAHITVSGDRIWVTIPQMVKMEISPHLTFNASPISFDLKGRIHVPWARIIVRNLPKSVTGVSNDEVLLDKELKPISERTTSLPAVNSNLIIHVGDDVYLSSFGLKAKLSGDLKLTQDKCGLRLSGQINIPFGRFHAYGQDLLIRKGELQFSGSPDQPYINLEPIRNPEVTEDGVIVGLRITGLTNELKVETFSEPSMSQQEVLSYLLRGHGLDMNSDNNSILTTTLIGLGVEQSGQVISKIGKIFGIKNLSLDMTGVGNNQQVQVSGYVLSSLQVKYGVGIFNALTTLTLRYRLIPRLYLEAVSSINQALDLLYQFDF